MLDPKVIRLIETSQTLIRWVEIKSNGWGTINADLSLSVYSKDTGEKALTEARYHYNQAVYEAKKEPKP